MLRCRSIGCSFQRVLQRPSGKVTASSASNCVTEYGFGFTVTNLPPASRFWHRRYIQHRQRTDPLPTAQLAPGIVSPFDVLHRLESFNRSHRGLKVETSPSRLEAVRVTIMSNDALRRLLADHQISIHTLLRSCQPAVQLALWSQEAGLLAPQRGVFQGHRSPYETRPLLKWLQSLQSTRSDPHKFLRWLSSSSFSSKPQPQAVRRKPECQAKA